ncbi:MAG: transcriptional regulator, MarR family [Frankiales bacterium]|nr:transcriptional regulator, MarR family [Frankiales bacterium]
MEDTQAALWSELVSLVHGLKDLNAHVLEASGIRCEQAGAHVLGRLALLGPVRLTELAHALGLDPSSVSRQVTALERYGWVVREKDPHDQRAQRLELTDKGRSVVALLREARQQALRKLTPGWSDQDMTDLTSRLARLNTDLIAHRDLLGARQETA